MTLVRDQALLLKRFPFGESSLVAHLCTRDHGRVHVLAKGAYRPTSRYFAILDYLDTLEIEWDHNPRRDLSNLRAGAVSTRRRAIPDDPARWFAAGAMIEIADLASRPAHTDPELYALLESGFEALEDPDSLPDAVLAAFELRYLAVLGLSPSLETCAACGGAAPALDPARGPEASARGPRAWFSAGAGGRLCPGCAAEARASGRRVGTLPVETLDDARTFLADGATAAASLSRERIGRVREFAGRFLDYHLETRPRTRRGNARSPWIDPS